MKWFSSSGKNNEQQLYDMQGWGQKVSKYRERGQEIEEGINTWKSRLLLPIKLSLMVYNFKHNETNLKNWSPRQYEAHLFAFVYFNSMIKICHRIRT